MNNTKAMNERKRKALLVLPLPVVGFLTMIFISLGSAKASAPVNQATKTQPGINTNLPDASGASLADKMASYRAAQADSSKKSDEKRYDPYYHPEINTSLGLPNDKPNGFPYSSTGLGAGQYTDPYEAKVNDKLRSLNMALNQPPALQQQLPLNPYQQAAGSAPAVSSADIDRIENMMKTIQDNGSQPDGEMQQLNGMLDKIMSIQNPDLVQQKLKAAADKSRGPVYAVTTTRVDNPVSILNNTTTPLTGKGAEAKGDQQGGFFSIVDENQSNAPSNAIPAVVQETQTVVDGSTIKLRLTTDVMVHDVFIPKDNLIYGVVSLSGERLQIKIPTIRNEASIFPVQLSVFDLDGLDGIHIPDAITRTVAKESANTAVSGLGLSAMDTSLGAQAAGAGIEAVKSLVGKKVKLVKVTVKAGYQILLRSDQQQQQ